MSKTDSNDKATEKATEKASKGAHVLALHTVTRPDDLGGTESNPRGTVFQVSDDAELERLVRVGAVRKATADEVKQAKKGEAVNVLDPASGSYSQTEARAQRTAAAITGEAADYEGQTEVGASKAK